MHVPTISGPWRLNSALILNEEDSRSILTGCGHANAKQASTSMVLCTLRTNDHTQSSWVWVLSLPTKSSRALLLKTHTSLSNISALLARPVCASHFLIEVMGMKGRFFFNCFLTAHLLPFHPCSLNNPVLDSTIGGCGEAANRQDGPAKFTSIFPQLTVDFSLTQRCGPWVMSRPRFELLLSLGVSRFLTFSGCFVEWGLAASVALQELKSRITKMFSECRFRANMETLEL